MWCFWCVLVVLCRFPRRRIKGGLKAKRWKKRRKDRASKEGEKGRKVPRAFGAAQMGSPPHLRGLHPVLKKKILPRWGLHPTDGVSTPLQQNRGCQDGVSTPLTGSPPHSVGRKSPNCLFLIRLKARSLWDLNKSSREKPKNRESFQGARDGYKEDLVS